MRALPDQDHYEVLEVHRGADPDEIERAYRAVRETYDSGSLALYSLFDDRDASAIRGRIEEAYRVLSDEAARRSYDEAWAAAGPATAPAESPEAGGSAPGGEIESRELVNASDTFRDLESEIEEGDGALDGAGLRRARLHRGFDLEQISEITKVSVKNLQRIEDEAFADLPATVYVRGFVTAYARTIGLDPARVVAGYIERVEEVRARPRGRFRSRP